ncbi:MAG: FixH family protein [Gammaproteobacteria bacterium]|nr:FixH family protein [Gammaproteobacteria bacterium]
MIKKISWRNLLVLLTLVAVLAMVGGYLLLTPAPINTITLEEGYRADLYADPALAVGLKSRLEARVIDGHGKPVSGCSVQFFQAMPGMQMSTDDQPLVATERAVGRYIAGTHEFTMGGGWELKLRLDCTGQTSRQGIYAFTLDWPN